MHLSVLSYLQRVLKESSLSAEQVALMSSKLQDNHRMCKQLAVFTQDVLGYGSDYKECHLNGCQCKVREGMPPGVPVLSRALDAPTQVNETWQQSLIDIMAPSESMTLVELPPQISEDLLRASEAELVVNLIRLYRETFSDAGNEKEVYVVTPHHVQRKPIKRGLSEAGIQEVQVDTVERMQGKEVRSARNT